MSKPLVSDDLWELIEPLLPKHRASKKGGRPPASDRAALEGILHVLVTGGQWERIPKSVGCSFMTCWRRLSEWETQGVWNILQQKILGQLRREGILDLSRAIIDSASVRAVFGGTKRDRTRPTAQNQAQNTKCSRTQTEFPLRRKSRQRTVTTVHN